MGLVRENLARVYTRIERACVRARRDPSRVTLVAVTKTVPVETIREAIDAGIKTIGENRVQEAEGKFPVLDREVSWHLVGHLQTNKVNRALRIFSFLHSVDSLRLAQALNGRAGKPVPVLIEVNTSRESTKFGVLPDQTLSLARTIHSLPNLELKGLMTIGPNVPDLEVARASFRTLRKLRDRLEDDLNMRLPNLSMGMTHDFEVAVEERATLVRIGTAIFGPRL